MANEPDSTTSANLWERLRHSVPRPEMPKVKNANDVYASKMTPLDRLALAITVKVGSMGFFFIILGWTILWCGYNLMAAEIPSLGWKAFDPFPAFVAYLLMSNVIQILLMPLIMVGQNVQSRHSDIRAELDFEINQKAEAEVVAILKNLEHNTDLIIQLMKHLDCKISEAEIRALSASKKEMDAAVSRKLEAPDA